MALIRFSNLVNDIRGAAGGNVFARNRSGAYVRNRTTPLNPQSTPQMNARAQFGQLAQNWRNLTEEERAQWESIAPEYPYLNKLGESRTYSGEQLYIKLNRNLQAAGAAALDSPTAPAGVAAVASITADATAATGVINISGTLAGAQDDTELVIQMSGPLSAGKNFAGRQIFRNVDVSTAAAFAAPVDYGTEYESLFGGITTRAGSAIFIRIYGVNTVTGQASAPMVAKVVIA